VPDLDLANRQACARVKGGRIHLLHFQRTVREPMTALSLCDQVDLWCYGRLAGLAVLGWPGERAQALPQ
jgi:hypothetical protein